MQGDDGRVPLRLTVNGTAHAVSIDPRQLLVEVIRDELRLTGTHIGCRTGDCGACTVRVDGRLTKSCLIVATAQQDADIVTIEGIAGDDAELHPVQQGFWDENGFQCGYCLPGMLFCALDLLERVPDPTPAEIRGALDGNLCRCTGYHDIVRSVQAAAARITTTIDG